MINCIVFGNVPLASFLLSLLVKTKNINVIGVVAEHCPPDSFQLHNINMPPAYFFCKVHNIPLITMQAAYDFAISNQCLGISVRYNKIFRSAFFRAFSAGIINFHGGLLPFYRGSNIANFCILNSSDTIGATIHYIDEGVDEGDIVFTKSSNISSDSSAYQVFLQSMFLLQELACLLVDYLDEGKPLPRVPQHTLLPESTLIRTYTSAYLESFRCIPSTVESVEDLCRFARAFSFPGHPPAYIQYDNIIINLTIDYS